MHSTPLKTLALIAVLAFSMLAVAKTPSRYTLLRVSSPLTDSLASTVGVGEIGDSLYDTQEGTHDLVTDTTGIEVEHDYLDVCLGDDCVPIDPFRFSN